MEQILEKITQCREARGWTEYQLAERSGVPQSTISSWYRGAKPTIPPLKKICIAFDISLSELFAVDGDAVVLTPSQKELLKQWVRLDSAQQQIVLQLISNM